MTIDNHNTLLVQSLYRRYRACVYGHDALHLPILISKRTDWLTESYHNWLTCIGVCAGFKQTLSSLCHYPIQTSPSSWVLPGPSLFERTKAKFCLLSFFSYKNYPNLNLSQNKYKRLARLGSARPVKVHIYQENSRDRRHFTYGPLADERRRRVAPFPFVVVVVDTIRKSPQVLVYLIINLLAFLLATGMGRPVVLSVSQLVWCLW